MAYISNDPNEGIRQVSGQAIPSGGINSFTSPGNEYVNKRRRDNNAYWNQTPREPRKSKAKPSSPSSTSRESFPLMMARLEAEMNNRLSGAPSPLGLFGGPKFDGTGDMAQPTPTLSDRYSKPKPTAVPGKPVPVKTNPIATPTVAAPPAAAPAAAPAKPTTPPAKVKAPEPTKAPAPTQTKREPRISDPDYVHRMGYAGPDGKEVTKTTKELYEELERSRAKTRIEQILEESKLAKKQEEERLATERVDLRFKQLEEHREGKRQAETEKQRKAKLQETMDAERTIDEFKKSLEQEAMDKFMEKFRGPQSRTLADRDFNYDLFKPEYLKLSDRYKKQRRYKATSSSRSNEDEENRRMMQAERLGAPTALEMNMKLARMAKNARKTKEASPDEY